MRQSTWRKAIRHALAAVALLSVVGECLPAVAQSQPPPQPIQVDVLREGKSSRSAFQAAERALPLAKLSLRDRRRVRAIIRRADVFRELPSLRVEVDPLSYDYFATHPEVAVAIWRVLGISKFRMKQLGPREYEVDSGEGTVGTAEVLYQNGGHLLVLCRGRYDSSLLPAPIRAEAVIHLQTVFAPQRDGSTAAMHRACLYVNFPSLAVGAVARLLSPMSNTIMDRNFYEITGFLRMMSLAMEKNPGWVEQTAGKLADVPGHRRENLLKTTARVYVAARKRESLGLFKTQQQRLNEVLEPLQSAEPTRTP